MTLNPAPSGTQGLLAVLTGDPALHTHPVSFRQKQANPSGLPSHGGWARATLGVLPALQPPHLNSPSSPLDNGVGIAGKCYK